MSSINLTALQNAIYDWIFLVTSSEPVIWAFENAPQPDLKTVDRFFIVNMGGISKIGQDYQSNVLGATGDLTIIGNREFMLNIQSKGDGAIDRLEDVRSSLEKPSVLATLRAANIAIVDDNADVINLTGLDDTTFIERGSLDILMRTHSEITDNVGYFNKTNITGEFDDVAGNTVYTASIPVDAS